MRKEELEIYTDYLISTSGYATGTGLSSMLDGELSHDKVSRSLSGHQYTSQDLWREVKGAVRKIEKDDGVLIFDDTIQEKEWTDENDIVCWHYDHCSGRSVKGINLLNALYHSGEVSLPMVFEIVTKPLPFCDMQTRKIKRTSLVTKNEQLREMMAKCVENQLKFSYILLDSWFSVKDNFDFIVKKKKHFIAALKNNRLVVLSGDDKKNGRFVRIDTLSLTDKQAVRGWLKGYFSTPNLYTQRWQHRFIESGMQRFGVRW